jgi:DNA-binding MarR family transcriptional regulator
MDNARNLAADAAIAAAKGASTARPSTTRTSPKRPVPAAEAATQLRDGIARLNRRLRQVRPVGELTQSQLSALTSLELAGAMTPRELADAERVQPPTLTRIIGKLEEMGLVQRTPHPTDGRQVILSATPAGRLVFAEHRRARDAWLTKRLAALPAEDRETIRAAADILSRLARDDTPA